MRDTRVALAQIAPKLGDVARNLDLHLDAARRAADAGAGVVVFPELSLTGYLLQDQVPDVALGLDGPPIAELLERSREIDIVVGFVEEAPGHRFHNAAAFLSEGRVLHLHRKLYLPTYGMFEEGRDLAAGERLRAFSSRNGPCGLLVCEDLWHPSCAWLLAQDGAEVLFVPSSGPTRGTDPEVGITSNAVWRRLAEATARFQTVYVVYVNRVGSEEGLVFGGGSLVVDPTGRVVADLPPLDPGLLTVDLDGDALRRARTAYPLLRDEDLELVHRELDRVRNRRYGIHANAHDTETGGD
jgi:predicted amidohydrolase